MNLTDMAGEVDGGVLSNNASDSIDLSITLTLVSNDISNELADMFTSVVEVWINGLVAVMGLANNVITIIVFSRMGFKETANITMTAIAFWDFVKTFFLIFLSFRPIMWWAAPVSWYVSYRILCPFLVRPIAETASLISSTLAAYIAIERCLCVSMPFMVRFLLTRRSVSVSCLAIVVLVIGSNIIYFLSHGMAVMPNPYLYNITHVHGFIRPWARNAPWFADYLFAVAMVWPVVTIGVTSVCTAIIVFLLKKTSSFRSKMNNDASSQFSARDRKTIRMLVVILSVHIVTSVPWLAYYVVVTVFPAFRTMDYTNLNSMTYQIVTFFSLVNSSVNLFIFFVMSSEFRQVLTSMFTRRKRTV